MSVSLESCSWNGLLPLRIRVSFVVILPDDNVSIVRKSWAKTTPGIEGRLGMQG